MVEIHLDQILAAARSDRHAALPLPTQNVGGSPHTLERIPQLPAARADVVGFVAHAHQIIKAALKRGQRQPDAIVLHGEASARLHEGDGGRDLGRLTGIESIIDQLFGEGDAPAPRAKADLHLQFSFRKELQRAAHLKSRAS